METPLNNSGLIAHIDTPTGEINVPLFSFSGWYSSPSSGFPQIYVNHVIQDNIEYHLRDDVEAQFLGNKSVGWSFLCDVSKYLNNDNDGITIEIKHNQRTLARQYYRWSLKNAPVRDKDLYYFIHIPKTGGTSIRLILENNPSLKIHGIYDDVPGFVKLDQFENLSEVALSYYDAFFGHFKYGIDKKHNRRAKYLCVLRDPFDYILSYYFYVKYGQRSSPYIDYESIFEAISTSADPYFNNCFTRMISGAESDEIISDNHLEAAISNIDKDFVFIGVSEFMQPTCDRLSSFFGAQMEQIFENVTPSSDERRLIDIAHFRKAAYKNVHYDLSLYEYALRKFWGAGRISLASKL